MSKSIPVKNKVVERLDNIRTRQKIDNYSDVIERILDTYDAAILANIVPQKKTVPDTKKPETPVTMPVVAEVKAIVLEGKVIREGKKPVVVTPAPKPETWAENKNKTKKPAVVADLKKIATKPGFKIVEAPPKKTPKKYEDNWTFR